MTVEVNYHDLPEHMQDGARRYVEDGTKPGDFMVAVLSNDLVGALERADPINAARIHDWAIWLKWEAPGNCWGSSEKVAAWINRREKVAL
jgi:hypothetical protein